MERGVEREGLIYRLPEECISQILSFTSPKDSCRAAAVSRGFRCAVESDVVWERFLPTDYREILSAAVAPVEFPSKKELYFRLCEPLLIDGGKKSFVLEKSTGKKCYMLSARELSIIWGDTPQYWRWSSVPESRFAEVAMLLNVCWLQILGKIETAALSRRTTYVAYLVFKLAPFTRGLGSPFQRASISLGDVSFEELLCLRPPEKRQKVYREIFYGNDDEHDYDDMYPEPRVPPAEPEREVEEQEVDVRPYIVPEPEREEEEQEEGGGRYIVPHARGDGWRWMEIAMGEFFNGEGDDGVVVIDLLGNDGTFWKRGLIVEGVEFRPKTVRHTRRRRY